MIVPIISPDHPAMFWLIVASTLPAVTWAAFCGISTIPFSLEVLPDGGTVLGCARPACFGWDPATGNHATDDASFIDHVTHRDGFVRTQDPLQRAPFNPEIPQTASCFPSLSCSQGQWVGGFIAGQNGAAPSLMCCAHQSLMTAIDRGVASLQPSTFASGGEVQENGQVYFDYLRNIQAVREANGQLTYNVEMGRISCSEPQPLAVAPAAAAVQQPAPAAAAIQQIYQPPVLQPAQPVASYGAAGYGYGAGFAPMGYYCFPADATVTTIDDKEIRMDELSTSDWIMSPNKNYSLTGPSRVVSWLHRMQEVETDFLLMRTGTGRQIKLTPRHYIMKAECKVGGRVETVAAEEIYPGDCLMEMYDDKLHRVPVHNITTIRQRGIYAPLTDSGKLLVNRIVVSCYSEVDNHDLIGTTTNGDTLKGTASRVIQCTSGDDLHCSVDDEKFEFLLDMVNLVLPPSYTNWAI